MAKPAIEALESTVASRHTDAPASSFIATRTVRGKKARGYQ